MKPVLGDLRQLVMIGVALFGGLCGVIRHADAIVVFTKGTNRPVIGYLVRQDDRTVVIRQELPGGKSRETSFPKKDIDELIITVVPERLAALSPDRPELYREYAEELAEKQRDPEARDAALRLYSIAAARGDENVRRGALLGLIALARTAEEERLFRAAAFLFDSKHDASLLVGSSAGASSNAESSWGEIARTRGLAPLREVRLDRLTEFDPAECVFRGGKWLKP